MKWPAIKPYLLVTIAQDCCTCFVTPENLQAKEGDQIWFSNLTKDTVVVMFPDDKLFNEMQIELGVDQVKALTLRPVDRDSYPYTVYCKGCKDFADRAARPRIIVYDSRL